MNKTKYVCIYKQKPKLALLIPQCKLYLIKIGILMMLVRMYLCFCQLFRTNIFLTSDFPQRFGLLISPNFTKIYKSVELILRD